MREENILGGEPIIAGTRTPVRTIVEMWRLGVTPEEIPRRLPHVTLAQIFDALGYFADHEADIQAHIDQNLVSDDMTHPASRTDA